MVLVRRYTACSILTLIRDLEVILATTKSWIERDRTFRITEWLQPERRVHGTILMHVKFSCLSRTDWNMK